MKRYLLLLVLAIYCLPNNSFAQGWSLPSSSETIDPSQGAMASTWFVGKYGGTSGFDWGSPKESKKGIVKLPPVNIHTAIELSIDEATGQTTARWKDGSTFVGKTYYGEIKGMGTMTFADGAKYHGQWRFDCFHGVGSMVCADGSKYTGEWHLGKPHGQGTFINAEGIAFTGKFEDGIPHGKCVMQDIDGRKYTARWYHGKLREKSIKPLEEEK